MVEAQRALLDELMGVARNLTDEEKKQYKEIQWDDKEVCGCYLIRFCPHDLFVNTKSDLGPCPKVHDPKLKESYQNSSRYELYVPRFETELAQFCEKLVQDLDRKVRRGRERIAQEVDIASLVPLPTEKLEQLTTIEEKIKKLLEQIETLGEDGKVDEAQALMKKVDLLNGEKSAVVSQASSDRGLSLSQEKKMALCETCGSFLVANETIERTQSHVSGKQHVGFGLVREYLGEYKEKKEAKAKEEEKEVECVKDGERKKETSKQVESIERRDRQREQQQQRKYNYHHYHHHHHHHHQQHHDEDDYHGYRRHLLGGRSFSSINNSNNKNKNKRCGDRREYDRRRHRSRSPARVPSSTKRRA